MNTRFFSGTDTTVLGNGCSFLGRLGLLTLLLPPEIRAGGIVTECTQSNLMSALNGGGVVTFACDGTIPLNKVLRITQNVVLDATGRQVVISGANTTRVFRVQTNVAFTARHLTISDGWRLGTNGLDNGPGGDGRGAGLLNMGGRVSLIHCTFTNHAVLGGSGTTNSGAGGRGIGAAVCNLGGHLTLSHCTLAANVARGGSEAGTWGPTYASATAGSALGGAVYSEGGSVVVESCVFLTNIVLGANVARSGGQTYSDCAGHGQGGALFATSSAVTIRDSMFRANQAWGGSSLQSEGSAEAGYGGALALKAGEATVWRSVFQENGARGGVAGGWYGGVGDTLGGAIYSAGKLGLFDSCLASNRAVGGGGSSGARGLGGAIGSIGQLVLGGCTLDNNQTKGGYGHGRKAYPGAGSVGCGGGIYSSGQLAGTNLTVMNCRAAGADGVWIDGEPMMLGAAGQGGGIGVEAGLAILVNTTLSGNGAVGGVGGRDPPPGGEEPAPAPSQGGAVARLGGTVTLINSIVANSFSGSNCFGVIIDGGHNLCSDGSAQFSTPGSLNDTDPLLSSPADNGGPTPTVALWPGSPAINAGDNVACPLTDQRGVCRPQGPCCDIGAFEAASLSITGETPGHWHVRYQAVARQRCTLEASTDLVLWSALDSVEAGPDGMVVFDVAAGPEKQFFRMVCR